jgi:hypothetical protein
MRKQLPAKIVDQIATVVKSAVHQQVLIRVYAQAEAIRLANIEENIALEDIVQAIIDGSGESLGCEVNPDEARDALLGITSAPAIH